MLTDPPTTGPPPPAVVIPVLSSTEEASDTVIADNKDKRTDAILNGAISALEALKTVAGAVPIAPQPLEGACSALIGILNIVKVRCIRYKYAS